MKKYVVIGLGNFGLNVAKSLIENDCEVLGIDTSKETVNRAKDFIDHAVICDSSDRDALEALMLKDFDAAIVSIGQDMAPSILTTLYLKEIGIRNLIVRAISEDHGKIMTSIGATSVIFPERDMAVRLANKLALKNALDYLPLGEDYGILEVNPPASFLGKTLLDLQIPSRFNCQVIGLKTLPETKDLNLIDTGATMKIPPSAHDLITQHTVMILIGKNADILRIQAL